ncbi:replication initiator [Acrocarpospora sp. B8E8]|uniref:replication initiator n=1 Tax=Acrocarpospora sp. B8E8 TaxID=3153572 RepID=UPI00325ECEE4
MGALRPVDAVGTRRATARESAGVSGGVSSLVKAAGLLDRAVAERVAVENGVCIRPIPMRRQDVVTGAVDVVDLPCGSWRESYCPPCARRVRQVRMAQCREGWHLESEPLTGDISAREYRAYLAGLRVEAQGWRDQAAQAGEDTADLDLALADLDAEIAAAQPVSRRGAAGAEVGSADDGSADGSAEGDGAGRRVRSTRRRQDVPDLPRAPRSGGTVGRVYEGRGGKGYRPSMFLTLTLPSYGKVVEGAPVDPDRYDYTAAARDALHFSKLVDRFVQNLRRVAGWDVQYFAAVEPQKRRAPHLHMAIRGTLPRAVLRKVVAATYHQVWWPGADEVVYAGDGDGDGLPVWSDADGGYVDPDSWEALPTWDEALDELDAREEAGESGPVHVARFGTQLDMQGLLAGSADADQRTKYLTKYLTKSLGEGWEATGADAAGGGSGRVEHARRLAEAVRWEPCSPECANWLRYGVQPKNVKAGLRPGWCRKKAHHPDRLGYGGRRVLVSRKWSGKTLAGHKADRRTWALTAMGIDPQEESREPGRYVWRPVSASDPGLDPLPLRLLRLVGLRQRWRAEQAALRERAGLGPPDSADDPGSAGGAAAAGGAG